MKKLFAFIVTGILALGLVVPTISRTEEVTVQAASGTGYTSAADVNYVKSGSYIVNWGVRDETCGFLSTYAQNFYTGDYTFDKMSLNAGGSSTSNAPNSVLYQSLQTLMESKQTHKTSYGETRYQYCYTDCVKSNYNNISSFYSGEVLSGEWDGGATWNREHTWPNSKGDASGDGENDIMMLRPTSVKENSSRGNKAYGEGSAFYDPNQHGQNVRGDCARIMLFVYTRWGNTESMWGSNGVMENLSTLLKWMEEDPVDTWEMGRNDAVQSITGTRNAFVDYPEYAWLLFGRDVPDDMCTPSGKAGGVVTPPSGTTPDDGEDIVEGDPLQKDIVKAPVVGKAYYFYMYQGNTLDVVYLCGGMDGYYLATSTNKNNALPVYLEHASNGYYLYCYVNGVKTYINMVKSGDYTNGAYETKASTVYTFDTTYNTLVSADGYFFGTRGDKSYTSIGPCAGEYLTENFMAHFIASGLPNDSNAPVVPDTPVEPDTPDKPNDSGNEGNETVECEHEFGEWAVIKNPTAEKEGIRVRFCENCQEEERESIPALTGDESKEDGCGSTIGCVTFGGMAMLAMGLYLRKRKEN